MKICVSEGLAKEFPELGAYKPGDRYTLSIILRSDLTREMLQNHKSSRPVVVDSPEEARRIIEDLWKALSM